MNVFVIPSWYPSDDYPINGIFVKEQIYSLCKLDLSINMGVSTWGQKNNQYLLWIKDHFKNLAKITSSKDAPSNLKILPNLKEYTTPTFTWTRKLLKGNIKSVIEANVKNLRAFEADFGPVDLIHAHVGYPAGRIAMEISTQLRIPYVLTEHMGPFPSIYDSDKQGKLKNYYKPAYLRAAKNIAVGPTLASTMEDMGIPNVTVVPNFIDEDFFKPCSHPRSSEHTFTFFTLASISPEKGIDQLLYAIREVGTSRNVKFRIGGEGIYSHAFKELAVKLGIDNRVKWLGPLTRDEALAAYQQCDAFVLPSYHESFGLVYIEALACGKPIIATKCGGPENIVNQTNGLLIEKGNTKALATSLEYMIENAQTYDSHLIRQDFLNRFSKKAVVPQIINLYKEIINNKVPLL